LKPPTSMYIYIEIKIDVTLGNKKKKHIP
jgi:hypothetical protein